MAMTEETGAAEPSGKASAKRILVAVVGALRNAPPGDGHFDAARAGLAAAEGLGPEERLRAADVIDDVAGRVRLLEQLLGNALASAFTGEEETTLGPRTLRAIALPLLAEILEPKRDVAKKVIWRHLAAAAALPDGPKDMKALERLMDQLVREATLMKSAARLAAVQALYQMEISGQALDDVRVQFESLRIGAEIDGARYREADIDLFRKILEDAQARQAAIDQLTDRTLKTEWPLGRIDSILRALFRAAGAEFMAAPTTPAKLIINEYVDVARAFFPEGKETGLVNAVLDKMAREARPDAFA